MRTTGDESRTLTDLGKEQAKLTGERLFSLLHADGLFPLRRPNCTIKVYQSSLTRAKETADILLEAMNESMRKVVKTHNLGERKTIYFFHPWDVMWGTLYLLVTAASSYVDRVGGDGIPI